MFSNSSRRLELGNSTKYSGSLIPAWTFPAGAGLVFVLAVSWITPIAWAYLKGEPIPSKVRNNSDVAGWFVVHVFTGTYALLFGALQMYEPLRNARRDLHRGWEELTLFSFSFQRSHRLPLILDCLFIWH